VIYRSELFADGGFGRGRWMPGDEFVEYVGWLRVSGGGQQYLTI